MQSLLAELEKWQTLAGAILGGLFALCVALLVASKARRHEEDTAAMLLIGELKPFVVAAQVLSETGSVNSTTPQDELLRQAVQLKRFRPHLSPLFDSSMARVMTIDTNLAAFLRFFQFHISEAEQCFARIETAEQLLHAGQGSTFTQQELLKDLTLAAKKIHEAAEPANLAIPLLTTLFMGPVPTLRRFCRRFWTPSAEKKFLRP